MFSINNEWFSNLSIFTLNKSTLTAVAFAISIGGLLSFGLLSISSNHMAHAQSGQTFKVIVQVTNNDNKDMHGAVYVDIDGSVASKLQSGQIFPAHKTIPYTFEFVSGDVPVGKGFTVEVVYGDDYHKVAYGSNTPSNAPETVSISIP